MVATALEQQRARPFRHGHDERLEDAQEDGDRADAEEPAADGEVDLEQEREHDRDDAGDDERIADAEGLLGQDHDRQATGGDRAR